MCVQLPRRKLFLDKANEDNVYHCHNPVSPLLGQAVPYLGNKKVHTGDMKHKVINT